jgi:uncharacterized membrane protein YkvA (DUF1232 family)
MRMLRYLMRYGKAYSRLTWNLMQDDRVPMWKKAIPLLPVVYVIMPFDIIPDYIPILGQVDDIGVYFLSMMLFELVVEKEIVDEYRKIIEENRQI